MLYFLIFSFYTGVGRRLSAAAQGCTDAAQTSSAVKFYPATLIALCRTLSHTLFISLEALSSYNFI